MVRNRPAGGVKKHRLARRGGDGEKARAARGLGAEGGGSDPPDLTTVPLLSASLPRAPGSPAFGTGSNGARERRL